MLRIPCRD